MTVDVIVAQDLGKTVSDVGDALTILSGVQLRIPSGQTIAITGASGSGKSTLLALLAGMDLPSAGRVLIDGVDLASLDENGRADLRAQKIGFVFQNFQLIDHYTALENVVLPLEILGRPQGAVDLATALLQAVGLGQRLHHRPALLSGGEQQRVALARAFVGRPRLVLADEPTGNLDAATGERIMDLMFRLREEMGATLVLVTHDPALAARCDRICIMHAGRLTEQAQEVAA
ncbi:MAG: ATP-binding cassette domain-containing protein [Thiomonas sp.]|nr:ATP-binding cassette domain-containing protein [Thiomonas sp.]